MTSPSVSLVHLHRFVDLFVEERTHFFRRVQGVAELQHLDRYLVDQYVQAHLGSACTVATARSETTRVLSWNLNESRARHGETFQGYREIQALMPASVVFCSRDLGALTLFWFLQEQVPTAPALRMLARFFEEHGVPRDIQPLTTDYLVLPLGAESVLVDPKTLAPIPKLHDEVEMSIDFISAASRLNADALLAKMDGRAVVATMELEPSASGATTISARAPGPKAIALTRQELDRLATATVHLDHRQRHKQLRFLIDVVSRFRASGQDIVALPKRLLVQLDGSHSGTYQMRLAHAVSSGLLVDAGRPSHRRSRRYRLVMESGDQGGGHLDERQDTA